MIWIHGFLSPRLMTLPRVYSNSILLYYIPLTGRRRDRFMPFPRALIQDEKQTTSSRIWTLLSDSISYNDNDDDKHTFMDVQVMKDFMIQLWVIDNWRTFKKIESSKAIFWTSKLLSSTLLINVLSYYTNLHHCK